jgi:hypothetical protein
VLEQPIIAAAEHRLEYAGNHRGMTAVECKGSKFITPERLLPATRGSGNAREARAMKDLQCARGGNAAYRAVA